MQERLVMFVSIPYMGNEGQHFVVFFIILSSSCFVNQLARLIQPIYLVSISDNREESPIAAVVQFKKSHVD